MTLIINNFSAEIKKRKILFTDINFSLEKKEILVIYGKSGCGKSTLLKAIAGFIKLNNSKKSKRKWFENSENIICTGNIYLDNILLNELDPRDRSIGYLMQGSKIYPHHKTPKEVLEFPYIINNRIQIEKTKDKYIEDSIRIFNELGFSIGYTDRIENLSGGEEQRLLLAKYLLLSPKVLLLDEPFNNLDFSLREIIRKMIGDIAKDKSNQIEYIIMVSHDINDSKIADKILLIDDNLKQNEMGMGFQLIKKNSFETASDIFFRLQGFWLDKDDKVIKNNIITSILSKASNKELYTQVFNDFFNTFNISEKNREMFNTKILNDEYNSDIELERNIKDLIYPLDKSLYNYALETRSRIIYSEIASFLDYSKLLDIGCGDGRVSEIIHLNDKKFDIELTDIYRHNYIDDHFPLSFKLMYSNTVLPYADNTFDVCLLLTVLHHSNHPLEILKESIRVSKNRIIIIESVLGISKTFQGKFNKHVNKRLEYARLVDWVYNRIVYDNDVNVPYNFLCVEDWKDIFKYLNLKLINAIDLGIDIEVVPEHHYLFVLEKPNI